MTPSESEVLERKPPRIRTATTNRNKSQKGRLVAKAPMPEARETFATHPGFGFSVSLMGTPGRTAPVHRWPSQYAWWVYAPVGSLYHPGSTGSSTGGSTDRGSGTSESNATVPQFFPAEPARREPIGDFRPKSTTFGVTGIEFFVE